MQLSAIILSVVFVACVHFQGATSKEMTCKEVVSEMTKKQMGGISKCTKSMTFKNGKDKAAKTTCILKCVMQAEGLLNEEGGMDQATFDKFLEKQLTPNMIAVLGPPLENCFKTTGPGLDPKEEFCKSYDPLIKCFMGAVSKACAAS